MSNKLGLAIRIMLVLSIVSSSVVFSEERLLPSSVFLDRRVELDFAPIDGYLFVNFNGENFKRIRTTILSRHTSQIKSKEGGNTQYWYVGSRALVPPKSTFVEFSFLLLGEGGQYAYVPPVKWGLYDEIIFAGKTERLRNTVLKRKEILQSYVAQLDAQRQSLERLQADAEVIANIGKIIEVQDEKRNLVKSVEAISKDIKSLEASLKIARALPLPKNYARREFDLTTQLAELAAISKEAERTEFSRRSGAEEDLRRKVDMIEASRSEDLAALNKQIAILKSRIEGL